MNEYHFIYLLREKQDIDNKLNIFKIGKSTQENTRRVKSYPSGSYLYLQIRCNDCHSMESKLIKKFKNYFVLIRGREYFKGDIHIMMDIIYSFIQTHVYETSYILENDDYKLTSGTLEKENKIIETNDQLLKKNKQLSQIIFEKENQIINLKRTIHNNSSIIHEWESRYNEYRDKYYLTSHKSYDWENKYNLLKKSTEKENSYNIFKKYLLSFLNIKNYWIFNYIISYVYKKK